MRHVSYLLVSLLLVGCGARTAPLSVVDANPFAARTSSIAEDAEIDHVCVQWYADGTFTDFEWRCVAVDDVRRVLFPDEDRDR